MPPRQDIPRNARRNPTQAKGDLRVLISLVYLCVSLYSHSVGFELTSTVSLNKPINVCHAESVLFLTSQRPHDPCATN